MPLCVWVRACLVSVCVCLCLCLCMYNYVHTIHQTQKLMSCSKNDVCVFANLWRCFQLGHRKMRSIEIQKDEMWGWIKADQSTCYIPYHWGWTYIFRPFSGMISRSTRVWPKAIWQNRRQDQFQLPHLTFHQSPIIMILNCKRAPLGVTPSDSFRI